jgi:hypothetical protein
MKSNLKTLAAQDKDDVLVLHKHVMVVLCTEFHSSSASDPDENQQHGFVRL